MELDWTTFGLQVVNFLVLVWLLKRFLYRPVMDAIARRQATIDQSVTDARAAEQRAEELRTQYEARLAETDAAHADRLARLAEEIAAERHDRLTALDAELRSERAQCGRIVLASEDQQPQHRSQELLEQGQAFVHGTVTDPELPAVQHQAGAHTRMLPFLRAIPGTKGDA